MIDTKVTVKNEKDIKAIAEQDRFFSVAISPLTIFAVVYVGLSLAFLMSGKVLAIILAIAPAAMACAIAYAIHYMLYWSRFGPSWSLYFTCSLNGKKYYIVKDGARRYRVYTVDSNSRASGISTDDIYDPTFVDWLVHAQPRCGDLPVSKTV